MRRHQALSIAAGLAVWAGAANAAPPDEASSSWIAVEARNHVTGAGGPAAVLFGVAKERGRSRAASLRIECFDGVTAVHMDGDGLRLGPWAVAVQISLDRGRFVAGSWRPNADGTGLMLSGERAIAFASELYGKAELRLAVVRPLSVPFVFTFAVVGAEPGLSPLADRCPWSAGPAIRDAGR